MSLNHNLPLGKLDYCQVCGGKNLEKIIDLGHQPPCDSLLWPEQLDQGEISYPLRFEVCMDCSLGQIDYVVAPEELFFPDYPYRSGITPSLVEKLSKTASSTLSRFSVPENSLVIDIGSNDGTVLKAFQNRGMRVLGIEATNIAEIANRNGVETLQDFFSEDLACQIMKNYGVASVIAATNVFAHVADLGDILRGVYSLLDDGGVFVTESHYLLDLLDTVQYDSIYHEHLRYYSLKSLIALFDQYGFTVTDAERIDNYGGSIRVYAVKGREHHVLESIRALLTQEEKAGLDGIEIYREFARRVLKSRQDLLELVISARQRNQTVVGVGCPGRASTLLNYVGLSPELLPYIAEQSTSLKLGLFLPGLHVPIVDEERMLSEQPDYAIMLSWHYADPIISKLREKGLRSKIVIPLPEVTVQ